MKGQLLKDYMLAKRDIIAAFVLYIFFFIFALVLGRIRFFDSANIGTHILLTMRISSLLSFVFLSDNIASDIKSGYMKNVFAMPFQRKEYIREKYLFAYINHFIIMLFAVLLSLNIISSAPDAAVHDAIKILLSYILEVFILETFATTFIISYAIKKDAANITGLVLIMTMAVFVIWIFFSGAVAAYIMRTGNEFLYYIYRIAVKLIVIALWIYILRMGLRWAEQKEF